MRALRTHAIGLLFACLLLTPSTPAHAQPPAFQLQWGGFGSGPGQFNQPWGVAVDPTGAFVYVADRGNHRIQKFTSNGVFLRQWGAAGDGPGLFTGPDALAVDTNGDVYVADHDAFMVQRFSADGVWLGGWPTVVRAVAAEGGRIYVTDDASGAVRVFDPAGNQIQYLPAAFGGDPQPAAPWGIALGAGHIYVADFANARIKIVAPGSSTNLTGGLGGWDFMWLAYDPSGHLLTVVSNNTGGHITAFGASGIDDYGWGSNGSGPGQFIRPRGIAVDQASNVYVADSGNHRIQRFGFAPVLVQRESWGQLKRRFR